MIIRELLGLRMHSKNEGLKADLCSGRCSRAHKRTSAFWRSPKHTDTSRMEASRIRELKTLIRNKEEGVANKGDVTW